MIPHLLFNVKRRIVLVFYSSESSYLKMKAMVREKFIQKSIDCDDLFFKIKIHSLVRELSIYYYCSLLLI
jgi:hypothetical protein